MLQEAVVVRAATPKLIICLDPTALLARKNLPTTLFEQPISFDAPIADHAALAFDCIYQHPYLSEQNRKHHGIAHMSRVAFYIPILANLYRRYDATLDVSAEDLKLLQIAALFHDSARENDEEDFWDRQSAEMLYHYLTRNLKISHEKAVLFAEAIANKDYILGKKYYELILNSDQQLAWNKIPDCQKTKNSFQKILHDADSLDIIRARDVFDARYLNFYQDYASNNTNALDEMAYVIAEARSLIELQGDTRKHMLQDRRAQFNTQECYIQTLDLINEYPQFIAMRALYQSASDFLNSSQLNLDVMTQAMREGRLFARTIPEPSCFSEKDASEQMAEVDIRKMLRRPGIKTKTKKADATLKDGNSNRSVSCIAGFGSGLYASAGFGFLNPDLRKVSEFHSKDGHTGYGKKAQMIAKSRAEEIAHVERLKSQIACFICQAKMGGEEGLSLEGCSYYYSEALMTLHEAQFVVFTNDPVACLYDRPAYLPIPFLQAVHLKYLYQRMAGKSLSIFEYSGMHNIIQEITAISDEQLIDTWDKLLDEFFKKSPKSAIELIVMHPKSKNNNIELLDKIKRKACSLPELSKPLDSEYVVDLQNEINVLIEEKTKEFIKNYLNGIQLKINEEDYKELFSYEIDREFILTQPVFLKENEGKLILYANSLLEKCDANFHRSCGYSKKIDADSFYLKNIKWVFEVAKITDDKTLQKMTEEKIIDVVFYGAMTLIMSMKSNEPLDKKLENFEGMHEFIDCFEVSENETIKNLVSQRNQKCTILIEAIKLQVNEEKITHFSALFYNDLAQLIVNMRSDGISDDICIVLLDCAKKCLANSSLEHSRTKLCDNDDYFLENCAIASHKFPEYFLRNRFDLQTSYLKLLDGNPFRLFSRFDAFCILSKAQLIDDVFFEQVCNKLKSCFSSFSCVEEAIRISSGDTCCSSLLIFQLIKMQTFLPEKCFTVRQLDLVQALMTSFWQGFLTPTPSLDSDSSEDELLLTPIERYDFIEELSNTLINCGYDPLYLPGLLTDEVVKSADVVKAFEVSERNSRYAVKKNEVYIFSMYKIVNTLPFSVEQYRQILDAIKKNFPWALKLIASLESKCVLKATSPESLFGRSAVPAPQQRIPGKRIELL